MVEKRPGYWVRSFGIRKAALPGCQPCAAHGLPACRTASIVSSQPNIAPVMARTHSVFRLSARSEEHTSELQSLMRISYAVFCLKKKKKYYHLPQQPLA